QDGIDGDVGSVVVVDNMEDCNVELELGTEEDVKPLLLDASDKEIEGGDVAEDDDADEDSGGRISVEAILASWILRVLCINKDVSLSIFLTEKSQGMVSM